MSAISFAVGPTFEVVVAGRRNSEDTEAMLRALQMNYFPNKVVVFRPDDSAKPAIVDIASYTEFQKGIRGKATAYVCQNYACQAPTTVIREMLKFLGASDKKSG